MKHFFTIFLFVLLVGLVFSTSCKKEYSCENCRAKNQPPIANAGKDTIITLPVDSVTLDGSASTDDKKIISYQWRKISGPDTFKIVQPPATKTIVNKLVNGIFQFELRVTDAEGLFSKDTVQITVNAAASTNRPPVARAGNDTTIVLPLDSIRLNGSASTDPDSNINSYAWTKIAGPSSFNITNANSVQTEVTNLAPGLYLFELKVTDAGGLFSKDTMQVIINNPAINNLPPIADAGIDQIRVLSSTNLKIDGSGSYDPDGTISSYLWTMISGPGPVTITSPNAAVTTITNFAEGNYIFKLHVTDNNGAVDDDTTQVRIINDNLSGFEYVFHTEWGYNDIIGDEDVYVTTLSYPDLFTNPSIPLEVSILQDSSTVWINVPQNQTSVPGIPYYYIIQNNNLFIWANFSGSFNQLIGKGVTVKIIFL